MNIVLIGYRGSGKSTIGRGLAARLGLGFVDTDELVVSRSGKSIRELFELVGESGFRDLETAAVQEAAARDDMVISAGGGAVLRRENVTMLKRNARVVWLSAPAEVLFARIQADSQTAATRPNLTARGGLDEVRRLLADRAPLYASLADVVVDVSDMDVPCAVRYLSEMV